jgi:hypothetical protein
MIGSTIDPRPGAVERRATPRRAGQVEVRCRFTARRSDPSWPAVVCNASPVGLCLHTDSPVRRKDLVIVELPVGKQHKTLLVRVVYVRNQPILGGRIAGCSLVHCRLSARTLQTLFGATEGTVCTGGGLALPSGGEDTAH